MLLQKIRSFFKKDNSKPDQKATGVVERMYRSKGYGFIKTKERSSSIFVHFSDTIDKINVGKKVRFRLKETDKGLRATDVKLVHSR